MINKETSKPVDHSKRLLESLSFELRTLLNGFVGPIQLLKYKLDDPELVEIFRLFDSSTSRLERLAVRTSIFQNLDNSNFVFKNDQINLVDLAKYCILDLQSITELENVKLNINENSTVDTFIKGDFNVLIQAFTIIFELAINLSTQNTTIDIDFSAQSEGLVCNLTAPTATFSADLNIQMTNGQNYDCLPWDILLAKAILYRHNAYLSLSDSLSKSNSLKIVFKKG
jgi:signal transduction histidine kinase